MIRYSDPFLRTLPLRRLLDRILEDMNYQQQEPAAREPDAQAIPVNVFQTSDQLVLVAPMPGASPDDIDVSVAGDTVHLRAEFRGPHQEEKHYILREWTYGPYERSIQLPCGVDAERTNASFNNGVLVLNLPKRDVTRPHRITLQTENSARGVQAVRSGHETLHEGDGQARKPNGLRGEMSPGPGAPPAGADSGIHTSFREGAAIGAATGAASESKLSTGTAASSAPTKSKPGTPADGQKGSGSTSGARTGATGSSRRGKKS